MTRIYLATAFFAGCCYALAQTPAPQAAKPDKVKEPERIDITARVKE